MSENSSATMKDAASSSVAETTPDQTPPAATVAQPTMSNWQGWAEIENDPIIFSTLLQEWGISNIQVNEIVPLDTIFETPSDAVYGLIFLSRWVATEEENQIKECPPGLWFANQTSSYSCASIALMNIINNHKTLNLGNSLNTFRQDTMHMSPKERGLALDQFDHVRNVHNSFATELDKMNVDWKVKDDSVRAEKKRKAEEDAKNRTTTKRRKSVTTDKEEEESGFHFIAYVPANNCVWKMDGMQRQPWKLTELDEGGDWLLASVADLQKQWESAAENNIEFSLLSLTPRTDFSTIGEEDEKMKRTREDWGPFLAHMIRLHSQKGSLKQIMR